jgi:hypothetical protein
MAERTIVDRGGALGFETPYRRVYIVNGREDAKWVVPEIAYYSLVCRHALGDIRLAGELEALATCETKSEGKDVILTLDGAIERVQEARKKVTETGWTGWHGSREHAPEQENCAACGAAKRVLGVADYPNAADLKRYYRACTRAWETPVYTGEEKAQLGLSDPLAEKDDLRTALFRINEYVAGEGASENVKAKTLVMTTNVCGRIVKKYETELRGRLDTGLVLELADGVDVSGNARLTELKAEGRLGRYARGELVNPDSIDRVSCAAVCLADLLADAFGLMPSVLFLPLAAERTEPGAAALRATGLLRSYPGRVVYTREYAMGRSFSGLETGAEQIDDNRFKFNLLGRAVEWLRLLARHARANLDRRAETYIEKDGNSSIKLTGPYVQRGANRPPPVGLDHLLATMNLTPIPVEDLLRRRNLVGITGDGAARDQPKGRAAAPGIREERIDPQRMVRLVPALWPKPPAAATHRRHDPCSIFVAAGAQ